MFLLSVSFSSNLSTLLFIKFLRAQETQGDPKRGDCPVLGRDDLCAPGARCKRQHAVSPTLLRMQCGCLRKGWANRKDPSGFLTRSHENINVFPCSTTNRILKYQAGNCDIFPYSHYLSGWDRKTAVNSRPAWTMRQKRRKRERGRGGRGEGIAEENKVLDKPRLWSPVCLYSLFWACLTLAERERGVGVFIFWFFFWVTVSSGLSVLEFPM